MFRRRSRSLFALLLVALAISAATLHAQFRQGFGRFGLGLTTAKPQDFDGRFNFCRVVFRSGFDGDGGGWNVDYPRADVNLSIRLSELTKTRISVDHGGEPKHMLIRLTDDVLFQCPFIMMTEVGAADLTEPEATRLREYLLKGGFLWADDFWGSYAWQYWVRQLRKALPADQFPIIDLPQDHPLFRSLMVVEKTPQIPSINFWAGSGGGTSERGTDSARAETKAILDHQGRVMVIMTHNTDLGDSFEREGDDPRYFYLFSVPGYAMGIDVLLYALTH